MQGYVLEVKNIYFYCSFFVYSNFIMPCFGWMLLDPFFPRHTKKNCSTPQNHHFSDPAAQNSEDHGPVPLLEYTQSCKEPCDRMNKKTNYIIISCYTPAI